MKIVEAWNSLSQKDRDKLIELAETILVRSRAEDKPEPERLTQPVVELTESDDCADCGHIKSEHVWTGEDEAMCQLCSSCDQFAPVMKPEGDKND